MAGPGFAVSPFASGFQNTICIGPVGLAFDVESNLLVGNTAAGYCNQFFSNGGTAGPGNAVGKHRGLPANSLTGLAFTKDGCLYAADQAGKQVVELDPATAAVVRTVGMEPLLRTKKPATQRCALPPDLA